MLSIKNYKATRRDDRSVAELVISCGTATYLGTGFVVKDRESGRYNAVVIIPFCFKASAKNTLSDLKMGV